MAGAIIDSTSTHWNTPPELVEAAREILGTIDLDPCSNPFSTVGAQREFIACGPENAGFRHLIGPERSVTWGDGLVPSWDVQRVYVNPPYGRGIGVWIRKAAISSAHPGLASVLMLIPAAVETKPWERHVWPNASRVCFLRRRPKFWLSGEPAKQGITRAVAFVLFGRKRASAFDDVCVGLGEVVTPRAEQTRRLDASIDRNPFVVEAA